MQNLSTKEFKNRFVKHFPGDDTGNNHPRQTPRVLYSKALPTPVKDPQLLAWSDELAEELEINNPDKDDINILGGNLVTSSMYPYAACYAGHQFGHWAGQLGDGRAITIGEWETSIGESWELQLKGAGQTPYSRTADGRAVLRSSLREYLMSEAMHHLGVPTTRALSLVATGDKIMRDMFYDGNPEFEPGAIVMRGAPSFLRFGNYEILAARKETENLKQLVDWTIEKLFPHIEGEDKVMIWFKEVVERTAVLMVEWMRVGFVHGVMNTDNMSILGLTIDYGPYSFVDDFDLNFTPNTTDLPGRRYAFGRQPAIAKWNLGCLAGAIAPLFETTDDLIAALDTYDDHYWANYYVMMKEKLGLDDLRQEDNDLIRQFENTLNTVKPDMTIFYQLLINLPLELKSKEEILNHFKDAFYQDIKKEEEDDFIGLIQNYIKRINSNSSNREGDKKRMSATNPRFILRNYLLSQAIDDLQNGEDKLFKKLQQAIKEPYSNKWDEFFAKRPAWATKKAGCSMLSCSS